VEIATGVDDALSPRIAGDCLRRYALIVIDRPVMDDPETRVDLRSVGIGRVGRNEAEPAT
jgi:hypothetical protein